MKKLGKYEIIRELGRGAMGVVYLARDPLIDRQVALKTITAGLAENPELLARFYREAQAAGKLQHPNIVNVYELGEENKTPYIAMEFLDGDSIEHLISHKSQVPLVQKVSYFVQVCRGLAYAHQYGVVHRDIKPANIMLKKDEVTKQEVIKVVDFGIARVMAASKTQTGMMMGTVAYMSPEQVRGDHVDGRSDIWSVGVTFQEFVTGVRPFTADNIAAVMFNIVTQDPKPISFFLPDVPADLDAVMARIFKKQVNERYQTLDDVLLDLEPVYRKLQEAGVGQSVIQAKELLETGDFQKARDLLRSAAQLDPSNREVRTLLEKASEKLRQAGVLPELTDRCSRAEALLKEGKLAEATEQAEAALKLDSKFGPALEIMQKVRAQADRERAISQAMQSALQQRDEGNLTEAEKQLSNLETAYGEIPQALELKQRIADERQDRERRKRLTAEMDRARSLWNQQKYKECIEILTALQRDFPAEAEVTDLLDTARADREEQIRSERQQERDRQVGEARKLLGEQKFAEALSLLDPLLQADPNDSVVQRLRERVLVERKEHAKRKRIEHEQQAVKKLAGEGKLQEAADRADALLKELPDEVDVKQLVEFAHAQLVKEQQRRKVEDQLGALRARMQKQEFEQAAAEAHKALETHRGNKEIEQLLREAQAKAKEKKEQAERDFIARQLRAMTEAIDKDQITAAIDLGNKTIVQAGPNAEVTRLMQVALQKQKDRGPKPDRDRALETAYYKWTEGKLEEADQILADVEKTQIFDPQVKDLREMLKAKKEPPPARTVFGYVGFGAPTTEEAAPAAPAEAEKTVFRALDSMPGMEVPEGTTVLPPGGIPGVGIPSAPAEEKEPVKATPPAAPPAVEPKKPEKEKKKKGKEAEVTKEEFDSTVKILEPPKAKPPVAPPPPVKEEKKPEKPAAAAPPAAPPVKEEKKPAAAPPAAPPVKEEKKVAAPAPPAAPPPVKEEKKVAAPAPPPVAPPVEKPRPKEEKKVAAPAVAAREEAVPAKAVTPAVAPEIAAPKKSNMPMIAGGVAVAVLAIGLVIWQPWKSGEPAPTTGGEQPVATQPGPSAGTAQPAPGKSTEPEIPAGPVVTPEEKQQRDLLAKARRAYSRNDSKGAFKFLDDADKIKGPLGTEIAQQRKSWQDAENNAALREKLRKEGEFISQADALRAKENDLSSLQQASKLYRDAIALDGPNKDSAQKSLDAVDQRIGLLNQLPGMKNDVSAALRSEDYAKARTTAQRIGLISESDGSAALAEVNRAETGKANLLQSQFDRAARSNDAAALDQLLNGDVQRFKGLSGTLGDKARELDGKIPGEKTRIAAATAPPPKQPPKQPEPAPVVARNYSVIPKWLSYKAYTEPGLTEGMTINARHVDGELKLVSKDLSADVRQKAAAGSVTLELKVNSEGKVVDGRVLTTPPDSSGVGAQVLSEARSGWQFGPVKVNGKRVFTNATLEVKFQ
jgi:serine/threonine-protein kinase